MRPAKSYMLVQRLFSLIALLILPGMLPAQQTGTLFSHFNIHNGLIMNNVEYIHIDMDGFVWLGTYAGLQRFDGYAFKNYTYEPDNPSSISDNFISCIFEDNSANLWIGTEANGLNVFKKEQESFRVFLHDPSNPKSLASNSIPRASKVITQDGNGHIWVNTEAGLNRIDLNDFSFESYYGDLSGQLVFDESEHALWIAGDRLKKFDLKTKKLSYYDSGPTNSILQDTHGNIWLGTDEGALILPKHAEKMVPLEDFLEKQGYPAWNNEVLTGQPVSNFYEDYRGNIWFSIRDQLVYLDREQHRADIFRHEPDNENSPTGYSISGIYGNKSGVLWISYLNQGVSKVNINLKKFNVYRRIPGDPNSLNGNTIRSVFVDRKKYLWVGTYDNGLNRINLETNEIKHYRHLPRDPGSLVSNYITAIHVDRNERLWIGSFNTGICYADDIYQPGQLEFSTFTLMPDLEIHEFTEDPAGRIWISTQYGFFIYDGGEFIQYGGLENQVPEVRDLNIQSVVFVPPNIFWLATWKSGLCRLIIHADPMISSGPGKDILEIHDNLRDQSAARIENSFITIHRDDRGRIWLGSYYNGLIRVVEKDAGPEFIKYDKSSGAPENLVYGLTSDRQGNIWISTVNGLGRFDPETEQFMNYYMSDGLQSSEFIWDASFRDSDGRLYFGGVNGLNAFYPEDIIDNQDLPKVFISKLIINNQEVRIGDEFHGRMILQKGISYTDQITLSHRDPVFSLEFTAMDNVNPWEVQYRYMLTGFDQDWIMTDAENRIVRYTNLNPGNYVFQVKASNSDGIWNDVPATLDITILTPWWKSWWAIMIYVGVFALLLIAFRHFILGRAQLIHEAKMEHLEREKTEEMYQMKLRFFTNISHEFRTPLTLILGPLQKIIKDLGGDRRFARQIATIRRNSDRLFRLIDQVIEFRRIETNKIRLNAAKGDIVRFLRELTDSFEEAACERSISLEFQSEFDTCELWYDENKIDKVVYNLLSNAFKFTPDKGIIFVRISRARLQDPQKEFVEIRIEDNGIGISDEDQEHIFDRYFRVENPDSFVQTGSGIGLSLSRELTELHSGKIVVESQLGKGTAFRVFLPLGKEHLSPDEIVDHAEVRTDPPVSLKQFALKDEQEYFDRYDPMQPQLDQGDHPLLLIVDDDKELRDFIKTNFSPDFIVIEAENGNEGFSMALKNNPDIIISDIMMPVMDGMAMCRKLKTDIKTSHIPIILLTAKAGEESKIEGLDTGADTYIAKPFTIKLMQVQISNILENRKKLRKKFSREMVLQPSEIAITSIDAAFLQKAIKKVEEHMSDTDFSVESFIRHMGMSRSRMHRKLKALTAQSTSEFIRTIRLKRAATLLEKSQLPVEEISYAVGFSSTAYFSKCFRIQFGVPPTEYARTHA